MSKHTILDRSGEHFIKSMQSQALSGTAATPQVLQTIEHAKAHRIAKSQKLEVVQYQPCVQDCAVPLLEGWHLLFFTRSGSTHMQDLRRTLLPQNPERDVQLMQRFKHVQAQYREYMAQSSQTMAESVASQSVIAEIRYGSLCIVPGLWLPQDMDMGLSLLPSTGGRLAADTFTVVEHSLDTSSASLDLLLVTALAPLTKAEQAAYEFTPGDGLDADRHVITLCAPAVAAIILAVTLFMVTGHQPAPPPSEEDIVNLLAELDIDLSHTPSASQLLQIRHQLMTREVARTK